MPSRTNPVLKVVESLHSAMEEGNLISIGSKRGFSEVRRLARNLREQGSHQFDASKGKGDEDGADISTQLCQSLDKLPNP